MLEIGSNRWGFVNTIERAHDACRGLCLWMMSMSGPA